MTQLDRIVIGDDPAAWEEAGFVVEAGTAIVGRTAIELVGADGERGIHSLAVGDLTAAIDGLPLAAGVGPTGPAPLHPNRVVAFDHLVVLTPDCDRSTVALESAGFEARRTRVFDAGGTPTRQTFFWLGDVILELAGPDSVGEAADADGPATAWGLAFTCDDLDRAVRWLGDRAGSVKDAAQKGRQISTVRTRRLDVSVPIALMSPHV